MDDFRILWQKQEVEEMGISVEELRTKAAAFKSRIKWRNIREQAACLFVILFFGAMCVKNTHTVPRIAYALIVGGAIYVGWHLQSWGTAKASPAEMASANCAGFYRRELVRQRDLLSSIWKWYLGPLIPGMALLIAYGIVIAPAAGRWFPIVYSIVAAAFFWLIGWINQRAASRLNDQIAELDRDLSKP